MPRLVLPTAALLAAGAVYLYHLGRFIGPAPAERQAAIANSSLGSIDAALVDLPYKVLSYLCLRLPAGSPTSRLRLASAILALLCGLLFYLIVRRWHGARNAGLAAVLFMTSSWLLHTGRFGGGLVMLTTMVLGLIALAAWANSPQPSFPVVAAYALGCGLALFVPGGVWFVLAATAAIWPQLRQRIKQAGRSQRLAAAIVAICLPLALAYTLARRPEAIRPWLGLPAHFPDPVTAAKQAAGSISYLVARGPFLPQVWLAHTPLLDVAVAAFLLLGTIFYIRHFRNSRVRLLSAFTAVAVAMVACNGAAALSYLVPLAYLVIATGLAYFLHRWYLVFPRNPIAQGTALVAVCLLVLTIVSYHTQRYFVAWRHSPDTIEAYRAADGPLLGSDLIQ